MKLRMKEIRTQKGMTQREVADRAGISVSYYTEIELEKKPVNSNRLEAIAKALRCSVPDLILDQSKTAHQEVISIINSLDEDKQRLVLEIARSFLGKPGKP